MGIRTCYHSALMPELSVSSLPQPDKKASGKKQRVLAVAPMPPEKIAYALARYSRSPDSIRDSMEWVRTHDSSKFLESFYFQYGHASIADLGHVVLCFEGESEMAATEIEDEQLWDGQARSSRYQDFSQCGFVTPPELDRRSRALRIRLPARNCWPPTSRSTRRCSSTYGAAAAAGGDEAGRVSAQHRRASL